MTKLEKIFKLFGYFRTVEKTETKNFIYYRFKDETRYTFNKLSGELSYKGLSFKKTKTNKIIVDLLMKILSYENSDKISIYGDEFLFNTFHNHTNDYLAITFMITSNNQHHFSINFIFKEKIFFDFHFEIHDEVEEAKSNHRNFASCIGKLKKLGFNI